FVLLDNVPHDENARWAARRDDFGGLFLEGGEPADFGALKSAVEPIGFVASEATAHKNCMGSPHDAQIIPPRPLPGLGAVNPDCIGPTEESIEKMGAARPGKII